MSHTIHLSSTCYFFLDDIELLGEGACRGAGWQDGIWPLDEGRRTTKECAAVCKDTKGCVAFDLSNKEGEKYDCLLLGHPNIFPASALKAECYRIKGAEVDPETRKPLPPKQTAGPTKKAGGKDPRWEDPATRPRAAGERGGPPSPSRKVDDVYPAGGIFHHHSKRVFNTTFFRCWLCKVRIWQVQRFWLADRQVA